MDPRHSGQAVPNTPTAVGVGPNTTPRSFHRPFAARNLGINPNSAMSSSASSTSTFTNYPTTTDLFPTAAASSNPSGSSGSASGSGSGGTNVYYLVFLGVLIVVVLLATCLAYRAFRLRRRYRTAAQLAIMRGQIPPGGFRELGNDWGLGGFAGWTEEGLDRWAANPQMSQREVWELAMGLRPDGPGAGPAGSGRKAQKVGKRPVFWEAEAEEAGRRTGWGGETGAGMGAGAGSVEKADWEELQPLTVHSLAPAPGLDTTILPALFPPRQRRSRFAAISALARGRPRSPVPSAQDQVATALQAWQNRPREAERALDDGEAVRVAVVIQMPKSEEQARREQEGDRELQEAGEEPVGWRGGMEIGVWEGRVNAPGADGAGSRRDTSEASSV